MAILISGTVVIDETSGTQNADTGSAGNNDIAGGAGVLPAEFDAALLTVGASSATATGVAVSGADADNSTGTAMVTGLPADLTDLSWTDSSGDPLDGVDSGLTTSDGTKIFLYTYAGDNNVLLARKGTAGGLADPSGTVVFAAYLDTQTVDPGDVGATEAKVWLVQYEAMFNPDATDPDDPVSPDQVIYVAVSQVLEFDLSGAPSGQNLFLMYGTPGDGDAGNGDEVALVVTASDAATGGTVNSSQGGGATTLGSNNQMIDEGEGLVFTFVTNANSNFTVPNLDQNEADVEGNILFQGVHNATAASFKVVQTQPSSKASTLSIEAFTTGAEPGAGFIAGYNDDAHVDIDSVVVKNAAGTVIENSDGSVNTANLSITITGGVATIVGAKAGYTIEYTTDGAHNRVQIDNSSTGKGPNGADFDIGDFQITSALVEPFLFDALVFEDDAPAVDFGNLVGTGTTDPQTGFWSMDPGADELDSDGLEIALTAFTLIRPDSSTDAGTFLFAEDAGSPDGSGNYFFSGTLTGDFDDDAGTADTSVDFTLVAYEDGHYELEMDLAFGSSVTLDTADGALKAGGPDPVQTLVIPKPPATPITDVVFFSALTSATDAQILSGIGLGATDPTEADLEGPPLASFIDPRSMNVSTSGIGVDNNILQGDADAAVGGTDESFVVNPQILASSVEVFIDNSVQGYAYSDGELLYYKIFYEDGSNSANIAVTTDLGLANKGQATSFVIDGGGQLIDAVQLTMASGDVKIPHLVFTTATESLASHIQLDFLATVTDQDGDPATSEFTALLLANELGGSFDFVMAGTASEQDSFNIDLASDKNTYEVSGFEVGSDLLVLIGDATAVVQSIDNTGADAIVTIDETGGQTTTVTVVGVDLNNADVVFG